MTETKANRPPVVLVHGIWNTAAIFNPLSAHLRAAGWSVHTLSMTPNNGDAPLEALAEQVANFVDHTLPAQQLFHLIGFSMGGLISRYYVQRLGGLARVQKFITISTPHNGTILATGGYRPGVKQMRPGSAFLKDLNKDVQQLKATEFYAFWTPFDLLILPPWSSDLGVGKVTRLSIPSHNRMIQHPKGLSAIAAALEQ